MSFVGAHALAESTGVSNSAQTPRGTSATKVANPSFDCGGVTRRRPTMSRSHLFSDAAAKAAYFSLAAAAVVFVSMLMLTGLHP